MYSVPSIRDSGPSFFSFSSVHVLVDPSHSSLGKLTLTHSSSLVATSFVLLSNVPFWIPTRYRQCDCAKRNATTKQEKVSETKQQIKRFSLCKNQTKFFFLEGMCAKPAIQIPKCIVTHRIIQALSIAVLIVWTLTEKGSQIPNSFISTKSPVIP